MDVHSVTMEPEAAAKAFREYRAAFMADRNRIDAELMRGYKALAEGKTLISLTEAMRAGGVDEMGRPKLAVAQADEQKIQVERTRVGAVTFNPDFWSRVRAEDRVLTFGDGTLPEVTPEQEAVTVGRWSDSAWSHKWESELPFIPPQYRPPHALSNYHLLWEAEWRVPTAPPRPQRLDPMLLRRLGGDLFAVVAAWDLTEIEKLVLAL